MPRSLALATLVSLALAAGCSSAPPREELPDDLEVTLKAQEPGRGGPIQYRVETRFTSGPGSRVVQAPSLCLVDGEDATVFVGEQKAPLLVAEGGAIREVAPLESGYVVKLRAAKQPSGAVGVALHTWVVADGAIVRRASADTTIAEGEKLRLPLKRS